MVAARTTVAQAVGTSEEVCRYRSRATKEADYRSSSKVKTRPTSSTITNSPQCIRTINIQIISQFCAVPTVLATTIPNNATAALTDPATQQQHVSPSNILRAKNGTANTNGVWHATTRSASATARKTRLWRISPQCMYSPPRNPRPGSAVVFWAVSSRWAGHFFQNNTEVSRLLHPCHISPHTPARARAETLDRKHTAFSGG